MAILKHIYFIQFTGTNKEGNKVRFSTFVTSNKIVRFVGELREDILSALIRMVAAQKTTLFKENNVLQSTVFIESYSYRTEYTAGKMAHKQQKKKY